MANTQEEYLLSKIEEFEKLALSDLEKYTPELIGYYEELAEHYTENGDPKKAEGYYVKAVKEYTVLAEIAEVVEEHANSNQDIVKAAKIKYYYGQALQIYHFLTKNADKIQYDFKKSMNYWEKAQKESVENEPLSEMKFFEKIKTDYCKIGLAKCFESAGAFFLKTGDLTKAQKYYSAAIDLYEQLEKSNPEKFVYALFVVCCGLALILQKLESEKTEEIYAKAFELFKKHYKKAPFGFIKMAVLCCCNIYHMKEKDCYEILNDYFLPTIEICKKMYEVEPVKFLEQLSSLYLLTTNLYIYVDILEAENFANKAIDINEAYLSDDTVNNIKDLATAYNNAAVVYYEKGDIDKGKEYYTKSIEKYLVLAKADSEKFTPYLATAFWGFGNFSEDKEKLHKMALALAKKYPEHPWCREIIERLE